MVECYAGVQGWKGKGYSLRWGTSSSGGLTSPTPPHTRMNGDDDEDAGVSWVNKSIWICKFSCSVQIWANLSIAYKQRISPFSSGYWVGVDKTKTKLFIDSVTSSSEWLACSYRNAFRTFKKMRKVWKLKCDGVSAPLTTAVAQSINNTSKAQCNARRSMWPGTFSVPVEQTLIHTRSFSSRAPVASNGGLRIETPTLYRKGGFMWLHYGVKGSWEYASPTIFSKRWLMALM